MDLYGSRPPQAFGNRSTSAPVRRRSSLSATPSNSALVTYGAILTSLRDLLHGISEPDAKELSFFTFPKTIYALPTQPVNVSDGSSLKWCIVALHTLLNGGHVVEMSPRRDSFNMAQKELSNSVNSMAVEEQVDGHNQCSFFFISKCFSFVPCMAGRQYTTILIVFFHLLPYLSICPSLNLFLPCSPSHPLSTSQFLHISLSPPRALLPLSTSTYHTPRAAAVYAICRQLQRYSNLLRRHLNPFLQVL